MRLYLKIAIKYLFSSRGTSLIISFMSFFGIFLSVSAILLTLGVFSGFQDELKNKILSTTPHIVITLYSDSEENRINSVLSTTKDIKTFFNFKIFNAFISNGEVIQSVSIKAVDYTDENFRKFIKSFLEEGNIEGIIIGKGIAEVLTARIGSKVNLISPFGIRTPTGIIPKVGKFKVGGIFHTGAYDKDFAFIYIDLADAREFFKRDYAVNLTEVYLENPYKANEVKEKLIESLGDSVIIRSWIDLNKPLFDALELEKLGLFFILLLMVLVASFNITSLLFVKVKERVKDIAIFKTFGMKQKEILLIFLIVGISIGIVGALCGVLNAYILAHFINKYKLIRVSEEVYMMNYIPVHIKLKDVISTLLGTFILSLLSSIIPSVKASKEKVIEVLRKE
ncbi:MAG TPA: ABC transporter permease [Aquifex aeolicus]|nr:ABC transporter permease [Aquifex aeolicus]